MAFLRIFLAFSGRNPQCARRGVQDLRRAPKNRVRQLFSKNIELQENFGRQIKKLVPLKALGFLLTGGQNHQK